MIILSRERTRQPSSATAVDLKFNPSFVISTLGGGLPREYVNGVNGALVGGAVTAPTVAGLGQKLNGTSAYVEFASATPYALLGELTLVWHGIINSTAGYNFLAARSSGSGASADPFELRTDPGGLVTLIRANSDYSLWQSTVTIPVGVPVTIVVTQGADIASNAGTAFYINGVNAGLSTLGLSVTGGNAGGNAQPLQLGTRGDLFAYAATSAVLVAGFARLLPESVIKSLTRPWQLFAPEPRRVWTGISARPARTGLFDPDLRLAAWF